MSTLLKYLPLVVVLATIASITPCSLAQGDNPPRIVSATFSTQPCTFADPEPGAWDPGADGANCGDIQEGQLIYLCLVIEELDWEDDEDPEEVYLELLSEWIPYFSNGIEYGPEPPPVPSDLPDFSYGPVAPNVDAEPTLAHVTIPFYIPEYNGVNQARLRGVITYDVYWEVLIRVSNEQDPDPIPPATLLEVCAVEDQALRPGNPPPIADAGGDQTIPSGTSTTLDGSRSFDGTNVGFSPNDPEVFERDDLSYTWEWLSGPERVDPQSVDGQPWAAQVTLELLGNYTYRLLVDDGVNALPSTDEVVITVVEPRIDNRPPRAIITGPDGNQLDDGGIITASTGDIVTLDGTASVDPDGDELTYLWRQTNEIGTPLGPEELRQAYQPLSGVDEATATWQVLISGTYYFTLVVSDTSGETDTALVEVQVTGPDSVERAFGGDATAGDNTGGEPAAGAGGGACGFGLGFALLFLPGALFLMRGRMR